MSYAKVFHLYDGCQYCIMWKETRAPGKVPSMLRLLQIFPRKVWRKNKTVTGTCFRKVIFIIGVDNWPRMSSLSCGYFFNRICLVQGRMELLMVKPVEGIPLVSHLDCSWQWNTWYCVRIKFTNNQLHSLRSINTLMLGWFNYCPNECGPWASWLRPLWNVFEY